MRPAPTSPPSTRISTSPPSELSSPGSQKSSACRLQSSRNSKATQRTSAWWYPRRHGRSSRRPRKRSSKTSRLFTVLKPGPCPRKYYKKSGRRTKSRARPKPKKLRVKVLESGVVGSLDYKIIKAEDASDLYTWLQQNK